MAVDDEDPNEAELDASFTVEAPADSDLLMPGDEKKMPMRQPISMHQTHNGFLYVRIHRREGEDRLLDDKELAGWVERLESFVDDLKFDTSSPPEFHVRQLKPKPNPKNLGFSRLFRA